MRSTMPPDETPLTDTPLGYQRISASNRAIGATRALFTSTLSHDWRR
jgi:hypothetical protein